MSQHLKRTHTEISELEIHPEFTNEKLFLTVDNNNKFILLSNPRQPKQEKHGREKSSDVKEGCMGGTSTGYWRYSPNKASPTHTKTISQLMAEGSKSGGLNRRKGKLKQGTTTHVKRGKTNILGHSKTVLQLGVSSLKSRKAEAHNQMLKRELALYRREIELKYSHAQSKQYVFPRAFSQEDDDDDMNDKPNLDNSKANCNCIYIMYIYIYI